MKNICSKCASNSWTPHSGWTDAGRIYTAYQCLDCGNRQIISESVKDFNAKLDGQETLNDLRNLLKI